MWGSNMAARKRRSESRPSAGDGESLPRYSSTEFIMSQSPLEDVHGSSQSCVDHSLLAILEDTGTVLESENVAEEESQALMCALTAMLDSVEDDDDRILSPFDILPDTELVLQPQLRDNRVCEDHSPSHKLRPRPKPPNETLKTTTKRVRKGPKKPHPETLMKPKHMLSKPAKVFTSSSLVSLVRLMHPYCLKLQVGQEDDTNRGASLFAQEKVLRYERPSGESDEEVNVVSDEEALSEASKEAPHGQLAKSVLVKGNSTRVKKRVSFGPVEVASFHETERDERNLIESKSPLSGGAASSLELSTFPSERNNRPEEREEKKTKSLSLQQYRELRQGRRPLVEKQGKNITKWPNVPEPPKELTPILPFCRPKTASQLSPSRSQAGSCHQERHRRWRTDPRLVSPMSPTPEDFNNTVAPVPEGSNSPEKKANLCSSDPPNPVLLPLPLSHTSSPSAEECRPVQGLKAPPVFSDFMVKDTMLPSDGCCPGQVKGANQSTQNPSNNSSFATLPQTTPPTEAPMLVQVEDGNQEQTVQSDGRERRAAGDSGIKAHDLTSLLEQFEETQAFEHKVPERETKLICAPSPSCVQIHSQVGMELREADSELKLPAAPSSRSGSSLDVPEALCTETVLSTQQQQPARGRKSIQIIEPRPLPCKKTRTSHPETPAAQSSALYAHLSSDHDYCGAASHKCGREQPDVLRRTSDSAEEVQRVTQGLGAAEEGERTASVPQLHPEPLRGGTEEDFDSTDEELQRSLPAAGEQTAPCSLPTPPPSPPIRGRSKRRYRWTCHRSDSDSSSPSSSRCSTGTPKRPRIHRSRSESSSCSSSPSYGSPPRSPPWRCGSKYSRSWSRSRSPSRSPSPEICRTRWRDVCRREARRRIREHELRSQKLKAIDERRVVYVGRIRRTMTHEELKERFSQFGEVECVSLHFRDRGDHYAFVTFYNMADAFAAIDNGGKLRRPDELPFDICFGGRRQFCSSDYADLDANREAEASPSWSRAPDLDFDSLLKQAQKGLRGSQGDF